MSPEILLEFAGGGAVVGFSVDRLSAYLVSKRDHTPADTDWQDRGSTEQPLLPSVAVENSRFTSLRQRASVLISPIALSGAITGAAIAGLVFPSSSVHKQQEARIGVVVDESSNANNSVDNQQESVTMSSYLTSLESAPGIQANDYETTEDGPVAATEQEIINTTPLGSPDLQDSIGDALVGDKAVVVLTADSPVGISPSMSNIGDVVQSAKGKGEPIFVLNFGSSGHSDPNTQQLTALAHKTGGPYLNISPKTQAGGVIQDLEHQANPTQSTIETTTDPDEALLATILGASVVAMAFAVINRNKDVIRRKPAKKRSK